MTIASPGLQIEGVPGFDPSYQQPDSWAFDFFGAQQPYTQKKLAPDFLNVTPIVRPPSGFPGRDPAYFEQPDPWTYAFFGGRQPYAGLNLLNPTGQLNVLPSAGILVHPGRTIVVNELLQQWQPDIWPGYFVRGAAPYIFEEELGPVTPQVVIPTFGRIIGPSGGVDALLVMWANLVNLGDVGAYVQRPDYADRSVQVTGTFAGGTVVIEGSNDGVNFYTLTNPAGSNLSFTSNGLLQVTEACAYIRPHCTASVSSVTVTMCARRSYR